MALYWKNKNHPCVDQPCTDSVVPIIGIFSGNEDFTLIRSIGQKQENALDYDEYQTETEGETDNLSDDQKRDTIIRFRDQKAQDSVGRVYPGISLLTVEQGSDRLKIHDALGRISQERLFFPSITPSEFNFSGVFLTNNGFQGVLHSFLRHNDKWREVQPFVDVAMERTGSMRKFIEDITNSTYMSSARSAINTFLDKLNSMEVQGFNGESGIK